MQIFPFLHPLVSQVLRPINLRLTRCIKKCTLPRVLILVMMSLLLKIMEYDHLNISRKEHEIRKVSNCDSKATCFPVDKRCRFNVYKACIRYCRRRIDVLQTMKRCRVSTCLEIIFFFSRVSLGPIYFPFFEVMLFKILAFPENSQVNVTLNCFS